VTLLNSEMPGHNHGLLADFTDAQDSLSPANAGLCQATMYSAATTPLVQLAPGALAPAGGSQPHNNLMPYLTLNFCIALQGVYPPRT
jgi:microcystin-dependent protein